MNGTEKDAGKLAPRSTTGSAPPPPPIDYTGWFAGAAQRMLLQKADIKQYVTNNGRLQDFDAEMADWGRRFDGADGSLADGSQALFAICERFELLKFVGSPLGGGTRPTRGPVRGSHGDSQLTQLRRELVRAYGATR